MGNIIWLASYPRSGNIWLQSFLHNLMSDARRTPTREEIGGFCASEPAAIHFMTPGSRPLSEWTWKEAAGRRAQVHKAITELRSDNVFASTRAALAESGGEPTITMEYTAAAIYLVRNPLDLAVSMAAAGEQTIDQAITRLETEYLSKNSDNFAYECHGSWSTHVFSWTQQRHAGVHLLRYEDMLSMAENTFRPLATFLGFNTPPERLARAIQYSSFSELAAEEEKSCRPAGPGSPARLLRVGKSEQWRDVLSADQVRRIIAAHGEQMKRFNYIPDGF